METQNNIFSQTWFLTAGETDPRGLMPITLIVARAIEIATNHANALNIGYSNLAEHRLGWVLARISVEVLRYPHINETYSMDTWIEGYNRFLSDRCFEMTDESGNPVAFIRSIWAAIDTKTRTLANLSDLERECFPTADRICGIAKAPKIMPAQDAETSITQYTFKYRDLDFNRHVNTVRYLDLVLNLHSLDFYDNHDIRLLDAQFEHECYYGEEVSLVTGPERRDPDAELTEIMRAGDSRAVAVKIKFANR